MKKISLIGLLLLLSLPKVSNAQIVVQPSQYVNSGGVASGPISCISDGTAALPCYTGSTVSTGFWFSATNAARFSGAGADVIQFDATGLRLASPVHLSFGDGTTITGTGSYDIHAYRSAAKTLKIDTDGTGGVLTNTLIQGPLQVSDEVRALYFKLTTDTTYIYWNTRNRIAAPADGVGQWTNAAGTGFTRLVLGANDGTANGFSWKLNSGNIEAWTGDGSGALVNIKGAGIVGNTYLGGPGTLPTAGAIRIASAGVINFRNAANSADRQMIGTDGSDTVSIGNSSNLAEMDGTRLAFNGSTSSFPALKRSTTTIQVRLADDSAYGNFDALGYYASGTAGVTGTCDTPTFTLGIVTTCGGSGNSVDGTYFVTGNFTTANNTNLQAITGLAWTFPANAAVNIPFYCNLVYSQATAAVSDSLGIQDVTVAPTNGVFLGSAETALGTTAYGDLTAFASTTATAVVTFTPSATATTFNLYLSGMIEQPSNASTSAFQIQIKTSAGADAITVYRGSYCKVG